MDLGAAKRPREKARRAPKVGSASRSSVGVRSATAGRPTARGSRGGLRFVLPLPAR